MIRRGHSWATRHMLSLRMLDSAYPTDLRSPEDLLVTWQGDMLSRRFLWRSCPGCGPPLQIAHPGLSSCPSARTARAGKCQDTILRHLVRGDQRGLGLEGGDLPFAEDVELSCFLAWQPTRCVHPADLKHRLQ